MEDRGRAPIESLISTEIDRRMRSSKWVKLDRCFKWKLVSEYLNVNNIVSAEVIDMLRHKIMHGTLLDVEYDMVGTKVISIADLVVPNITELRVS
jgi:hypothetical protein